MSEIRNADQYAILLRYGRGAEVATIVAETGLSQDYVNGIVATVASFNRPHAREMAIAYDRRRAAVAAANPPPSVVKHADPVRPERALKVAPDQRVDPAGSIESLLIQAEKATASHPQRLAAKIRALIDDLEGVLERIAENERAREEAKRARREAAEKVAELAAALEKARQALKQLNGGAPAPASRPAKRRAASGNEEPAARDVRAWATRQNMPCPSTGRIPYHVRDAYRLAHDMAKAS